MLCRGLIVVGSPRTLVEDPSWRKWIAWVRDRGGFLTPNALPQLSEVEVRGPPSCLAGSCLSETGCRSMLRSAAGRTHCCAGPVCASICADWAGQLAQLQALMRHPLCRRPASFPS